MSAIDLNFKKIGQGDPIIILHGLFGSLDNWQTIANELKNYYCVYLVDLRNHGRSPHSQEMNYELMAADVIRLMHKEYILSAGLIGHSMGGKVVLQIIQTESINIRKSIVVDIAPKAYPKGHEVIFKAMMNLDLTQIVKRSEAEEQISKLITEPIIRQFILKNLDRNTDGSFNWKLNLDALYVHYPSISSAIVFSKVNLSDVLFLLGEKSDYVNDIDRIEIKKILPNAHFQIVKGSGHWVHAEKPMETISAIRNYFNPGIVK
ncbi:MAG: alpha/beta fold hydrolase [Saprospiraceae bacterium]